MRANSIFNNSSSNTYNMNSTKDFSKSENNIIFNNDENDYKQNIDKINAKYNKNQYNPFSQKNIFENPVIKVPNDEYKYNNKNNKDKIPNITLTSILSFSDKKIKEKGGQFDKIMNLFNFKKKKENIFDDNNNLETLEQNIINEKRNSYDIAKLKMDLNENKENTFQNKNKRLNIYEEEKEKEYDNNNFLMNSNNKYNLGNSCHMIEIDKSSEYTLQTGTNIDYIIKKKSNWSPLLIGILLGSGALFYLVYKNIKMKEIIVKINQIFKIIPEFFDYIGSNILSGIEDFMERYDDIYRLFAGITIIIVLWIVFRLLFNKMKNKITGKK